MGTYFVVSIKRKQGCLTILKFLPHPDLIFHVNHEGARHCRKPLGRRSVTKGPISSEKYLHYFHCPKYVLSSILSYSRNQTVLL